MKLAIAISLALSACSTVDENLGNTSNDPPPLSAKVFGPTRWAISLGGPLDDYSHGLALTSEGDIIVGGGIERTAPLPLSLVSDGFITKRSVIDGSELWTVNLTPGDPEALSAISHVAVDSDGNLVASGSFQRTVDFGGQTLTCTRQPIASCAFLAKYDANGALMWARGPTVSGDLDYESFALADDGTIYVVGQAWTSIDVGDGPIAISGSAAYVVALNPSGAMSWGHAFTSSPGDSPATIAIAIAPGGDVVVTGGFLGSLHIDDQVLSSGEHQDEFIARFSSSGALRWARVAEPSAYIDPYSVEIDANDDTLALGTDYVAGSPYQKVHVIDPVGHDLRAIESASHGIEARALTLAPDGTIIVGGWIQTTTPDLGTGPLVAPSGTRIGDAAYLAAYDANGGALDAIAFPYAAPDSPQEIPWAIRPTKAGGFAFVATFAAPTDVGGITVGNAGARDVMIVMLDPPSS
ncbi:MAG TPA: hypothetical protein VL463_18260 [Kofleriaceae bacterium]|nr:hypothetical protein [Kofleriaceae bacterium]